MRYSFLLIPIALAILNEYAVASRKRQLEYFAKPATLAALLAWLLWFGDPSPALGWFAAGLAFSLLGDILLLLPGERFLLGMGTFLLAHLAYIVGLNLTPPPLNAASLILALVILLPAGVIFRRLASKVSQPRLKLPIQAYAVALGVMTFSALLTLVRAEWPVLSALLISVGALCFLLSDVLLGWDRFVAPVANNTIRMTAYHLGQILIAVGAALSI